MGYENVYEKLKHEIIWLDIKPETMIALTEVADRFGVSRTPVKEALVHLHAEGWIMRHGSHFFSSPLTIDLIRDLTEIRSFMEIQAYIWAIHRINTQGIKRLEAIVQELGALNGNTSNRNIIEIDFVLLTFFLNSFRNIRRYRYGRSSNLTNQGIFFFTWKKSGNFIDF